MAAVASAGDDTSTAGGGGRSGGAALLELLQGTAATLVPPDALCIAEGKAVWTAYVDLYVLEHDGTRRRRRARARARARRHAAAARDGRGGRRRAVVAEAALPLPLGPAPLAVSFGVLDGQLLLDPTREEESLVSTGFTVPSTPTPPSPASTRAARLDDDLLARATQAARERPAPRPLAAST